MTTKEPDMLKRWAVALTIIIVILVVIGINQHPSSPAPSLPQPTMQYATATDVSELPPKPDKSARDAAAKQIENQLLSSGIDATVRATGKNHDTLRISWAAMSRPVVYNAMNSRAIQYDAPELGFKRVILTDDGSFSGESPAETWAYRWDGLRWKRN